MRYLLIGSGPAAISAAEEIRREDPDGAVTIVTADDRPARSPVMLSYFVSGHHPREGLSFRDADGWAAAQRVELRAGLRVVATDTAARSVTLACGGTIGYDRLLIATGASPVIPPLPGIGIGGVLPFRTLADAEQIAGGRERGRQVAIMGGGFIGIKLACHLRDRGERVTIFEREPRLASRIFDQRTSDIVRDHLRRQGIAVEIAAAVREVESRDGQVAGVALDDGRTFPAGLLVVAVGVRPNTAFADPALGATRLGIPVDRRMETAVPGVFAAGDAAATVDTLDASPGNNAIWPAATRQGRVAGANMAGRNRAAVHNFSLNALNLDGLQVTTAGHPGLPAGGDVSLFARDDGKGYRKWVVRSGRLVGFILIGDPSPAACLLARMKRGDLLRDPANPFPADGPPPGFYPLRSGRGRGSLWPEGRPRRYRQLLSSQ